MGSIWKAVTGLFKGSKKSETKEKMEAASTSETSINQAEEQVNNRNASDDSDEDDEDFVPNEANEGAESEELSDGDPEDDGDSSQKRKTDRKKAGKKRKAPTKAPRKAVNGTAFKRRRLRNRGSEDSDDPDDLDFTVSESHTDGEEDDHNKPSLEQLAVQEAAEKAETDRLWAEFLKGVDEDKLRRKNRGQQRVIEKVVTKTVDFAGEKVSVQEKVKVTINSSENGGILSASNQDSPSSTVSTVALSDVSTSNASSSTAEPVAGPSSGTTVNGDVDSNSSNTKKPLRRGGISILGSDPEAIGLDELDKRGLSGLLKAFQNKNAQAKKIGTLEKSKLDWEQFKRTKGLEEELTHHNKSRDTYIDKQEFLQRADYRQFEIERSMRATQRSKRLANNN